MVSSKFGPKSRKLTPSPCLSPGAPLGHWWTTALDSIGTGSRAPPGAANPNPPIKDNALWREA